MGRHFDQTWRRFQSKVSLGLPQANEIAAYPAGRERMLRIDDLPIPGASDCQRPDGSYSPSERRIRASAWEAGKRKKHGTSSEMAWKYP